MSSGTPPSPSDAPAPRTGLLGVLALTLVAAVHSGALAGPFLWDDRTLIVEDILDQPRPLLDYVLEPFWRSGEAGAAFRGFFRPVTTLSFVFDGAWSSGNPVGFHLTNLLLHLAVVGLLFGLGRRFGASPAAAFAAAVAFGVAPRLCECVAWISGRTDTLAALCGALALTLYPLRSLPPATTPHEDRGSLRELARTLGAAACLIVGVAAKEVALAFLVVIGCDEALSLLRGHGSARSALGRLLPSVVLLAAYTALRVHVLAGLVGEAPDYLGWRGFVSLEAVGRYAVMLVDFARPRTQIGDVALRAWGYVGLGAVVLLAASAGLAWLIRRSVRERAESRSDPALLALVLALTSIAPVLHVVPLALNVVAADRFLYVPLFGLALAGACVASRFRLGRAQRTLAAALLVAGMVGTVMRERAFGSELEFWLDALRTTDVRDTLPLHETAGLLYRANEFELAREAYATVTRRVLARHTARPLAVAGSFSDLANAYSALGRYDEALLLNDRMLSMGFTAPRQAFNAALLHLHREEFAQARELCLHALSMLPAYPAARATLAALPELEREHAALLSAPPDALRSARYFRRLGARAHAQRSYLDALGQAGASAPVRDEALLYLVTFGDTPALANASARYPTQDPALTTALEARLGLAADIRNARAELVKYFEPDDAGPPRGPQP